MTTQHRFTSWSVYPKGERHERNYFTSEHHALDVACDWSIERGGKAMVIECNDQPWMEVSLLNVKRGGDNAPLSPTIGLVATHHHA